MTKKSIHQPYVFQEALAVAPIGDDFHKQPQVDMRSAKFRNLRGGAFTNVLDHGAALPQNDATMAFALHVQRRLDGYAAARFLP